METILTRRQAQEQGLARYLGLPCKRGHDGWRFKTGHCISCCAEARSAPHLRETAKNRSRNWYRNNKPKAAETQRQYRAANPGYDTEAKRRWKAANPASVRAATAERRAARVKATPRWLTKSQRKEMREIYKRCPDGSEVDHVIPIKSAIVCGLHVPWNLQHLTKEANRRKSNKVFQRLALAPNSASSNRQAHG